uniref:Uncharacterized protein n=1 Tax=Physcomitrium patens TaxID=3218 RepID=A0A2K1JVY3_PHYPA|nr:hypothetical protein PHYPA_015457 [Physcomitrium patens]
MEIDVTCTYRDDWWILLRRWSVGAASTPVEFFTACAKLHAREGIIIDLVNGSSGEKNLNSDPWTLLSRTD